MLKVQSVRLGVNLAQALYENNKSITPVPNTLLQELSFSSYKPLGAKGMSRDNALEELVYYIRDSAEGYNTTGPNGSTQQYQGSHHDTYMDNYIRDMSALCANHIQYARSVVYSRVEALNDAVVSAVSNTPAKNAEDFFKVNFYQIADVFRSSLIEEEVMGFDAATGKFAQIINFGEAFNEFDYLSYVATGDSTMDAMIASWAGAVGIDRVTGYVRNHTDSLEYTLSETQLLDYHLANYLFYRALSIKQDLATNLGLVQLVSKSADNRDYHARQLRGNIDQYDLLIRQGYILGRDTQTGFSYMGNAQYNVIIYDESFQKACQQGATLEHIFGFIAKNNSASLTVDQLLKEGPKCADTWNSVRTLYGMYVQSNLSSTIRMAFKLSLPNVLDANLSEDETIYYESHPGFKQMSIDLSNQYLDSLADNELNIPKVSLKIIAAICYRHSNAYELLNGMIGMVEADAKVTMQDAALYAQVHYLTDFMLEQGVIA